MGLGFDRTGSYRDPLIAFLVATLTAAVPMTHLGPCRFSESRPIDNRRNLSASMAADVFEDELRLGKFLAMCRRRS